MTAIEDDENITPRGLNVVLGRVPYDFMILAAVFGNQRPFPIRMSACPEKVLKFENIPC